MRGGAWGMAFVMLAFSLAGCADGGGKEPKTDDVFSDLDGQAQATQTTGAIAGVVVDAAIRPLVGANVTIVGSDKVATTYDQGRFAFEGLEPGAYFLDAAVRRHAGTQVSVDVLAAEVATVRIMLIPLTTAEPYHVVQNFRGHIENYLGFANFAAEVIAPGTLACMCAWDIPVSANLTTVMVEAIGQVAVPNPGTPATVPGDAYWEVFANSTQETLRESAYSEFPVVERISADTFDDDAPLTGVGVRMTCGVWPCVTMDYDLFVTTFYHEEAPEGWSFLAGDT